MKSNLLGPGGPVQNWSGSSLGGQEHCHRRKQTPLLPRDQVLGQGLEVVRSHMNITSTQSKLRVDCMDVSREDIYEKIILCLSDILTDNCTAPAASSPMMIVVSI